MEKISELYGRFWRALEEITKIDKNFQEFKKAYMNKKEEWKSEYKKYKDVNISFFIEMACRERRLPIELSHRLMRDFGMFVLLCLSDRDIERDAWLWKPEEWWFYFWKYYEVRFKDKEEQI